MRRRLIGVTRTRPAIQTLRAPALSNALATWAILIAAGALILFLRRPEDLLAAQFVAEEGNAFYAPTFFHSLPELLATPWSGYLQVVPRLGYTIIGWMPPAIAPLIENIFALAMPLAVAAYIASRRMACVIPDDRARLLVAGLLLVLPAQVGVLGTFVNAQWYLAIWMVCLAFVVERRRWELFGLALAGLSGPFSILLAPVYWWRRARWAAVIVTGCAIAQLVVVLMSGRHPGFNPNLFAALGTLGLHGVVIPVLGLEITAALKGWSAAAMLFAMVVLTAALVRIAVRSLPRSILLPVGYAGLAIALAGIAAHRGVIWDISTGARYFLPMGLAVAGIIVAGVRRADPTALLLTPLLVLGIVADFRLATYPPQDWQAHAGCIGSKQACVVPIYPSEYSILWPGTDGTYVMPLSYDP